MKSSSGGRPPTWRHVHPGRGGSGGVAFPGADQGLSGADAAARRRPVDWVTRPVGRDAFLEPIAQALNADTPSLRDALATRLASQDLVLLHGCIGQKFDDPELVQYYADYLPSLVAGFTGQGRLKCVQPIEWPAQSAALSFFDRLIRSRVRDSNDRDGALGFVKALQTAGKARPRCSSSTFRAQRLERGRRSVASCATAGWTTRSRIR